MYLPLALSEIPCSVSHKEYTCCRPGSMGRCWDWAPGIPDPSSAGLTVALLLPSCACWHSKSGSKNTSPCLSQDQEVETFLLSDGTFRPWLFHSLEKFFIQCVLHLSLLVTSTIPIIPMLMRFPQPIWFLLSPTLHQHPSHSLLWFCAISYSCVKLYC